MQQFLHISGSKHEQKLCLETVAQKHNVFGILPTGFGKSLNFQLLLRLLKDLWKLEHACVSVVTNQVSILKDQVEELRTFAMSPLSRRHAKTTGHFCSERLLASGCTVSRCRSFRITSWCCTLIG